MTFALRTILINLTQALTGKETWQAKYACFKILVMEKAGSI
jgi:hypothetical protein